MPQGLKPVIFWVVFGPTKSCPDTKHFPQRLKPSRVKVVLMYGLKPVPFKPLAFVKEFSWINFKAC